MKINILVGAILITTLTACASIVSKSAYDVTISSDPNTANFVITNSAGTKVANGEPPETIKLHASSGFFAGEVYTISLEKDGYLSKEVQFTSTLDGWYFGNILLGGLIGMLIVDPATGAMFKLPQNVSVSFDQEVTKTETESLIIATVGGLTDEQRAQLIPIN